MRKTICGNDLPEFEDRVERRILTNVPTKYVLIDTETGQVYRGRTPEEKIESGGYDWAPLAIDVVDMIKTILRDN